MFDPKRFAGPTIKGYCYQFDKTILQIMRSTRGQITTVEHLEDVGLKTADSEAGTQCKYYPATHLTNSVIREPILEMIRAHKKAWNSSRSLSFTLYIHTAGPGPSYASPNSVEDLKTILKHTKGKGADKQTIEPHISEGFSDEELGRFLDDFSVDEGVSFEEQQQMILSLLATEFKCKEHEADSMFYAAGLRKVVELSMNPDPASRMITREDFKKSLRTKTALFDEWYAAAKGAAAYHAKLLTTLTQQEFFNPRIDRAIALSSDYTRETVVGPTAQLIAAAVRRHYQVGKALHNAKPLTFIVRGTAQEVRSLKKEVLSCGIEYNDGYEEVDFQLASFLDEPMVYRHSGRGGKVSDVVTRSSYVVRIVSEATYLAYLRNAYAPATAVTFDTADWSDRFASGRTRIISALPLAADQVAFAISKN